MRKKADSSTTGYASLYWKIETFKFYKDNNKTVVDSSAYSPYLNPIDHE